MKNDIDQLRAPIGGGIDTESDNDDRDAVADLLESVAADVRDGQTELSPHPGVETEEVALPGREDTITRAVVRFELPEEVAAEVLEENGELDVDALSDRMVPVPLVDGERV